MNDHIKPFALAIGAEFAGGFYAGSFVMNGDVYDIAVSPKAEGERDGVQWNESWDDVPGARSFVDGLANTDAMAAAGSKLAKWARGLRIGGFDDWHIAAQDVKEIIYRNLKPTTDDNSVWARSGINLHALPPTLPYSHQPAVQTTAEDFKQGGAQAFEDAAYWTSTQPAADSDYAWYQYFLDGGQDYYDKPSELRARAVRTIKRQ
jgi:hypothetical protein